MTEGLARLKSPGIDRFGVISAGNHGVRCPSGVHPTDFIAGGEMDLVWKESVVLDLHTTGTGADMWRKRQDKATDQ